MLRSGIKDVWTGMPLNTRRTLYMEPGLVCKGRLCSEVLLVISDGGVIWTVGVIIDSTSSQFLPSSYVSGSGDNHIDVCHATRDEVQPFILYVTD